MAERDQIVVDYILNTENFKKGLSETNNQLEKSGELVDKNGKKVNAMSNSYKHAGQEMSKAIVANSEATKVLTKQTDNLVKQVSEFNNEITESTEKAKNLKTKYREAMLDVQNGVEGAAERAGELKDAMDDANEAARNLASGSKFEQFGNTLGSLTGKLAALDFEGAAERARDLSRVAEGLTFKETTKGLKSLASSGLNLIGSLVNPFTLTVAAIGAVGYAIYSLITAEDEEIKKLKEAQAVAQTRYDAEINSIDNDIKALKALGQNTEDLERKKTKLAIANQQLKVKLAKQQYAIEREAAVNALSLLFDRNEAEKRIAERELQGDNEKFKALRAAELELNNLQGDLRSERLTSLSEASKAAITITATEQKEINEKQKEGTDKAKSELAKRQADYKKHLQEMAEDAKDWEAQQIAPQIKITNAAEVSAEQRKEIVDGFYEHAEAATIKDYDFNLKLLLDSGNFQQAVYDEKLKQLNDYLALGQISQEQYNEQYNALEDEKLQQDIERLQKRFEAAQFFVNQGLAASDAIAQIQRNQSKEGDRLTASQQLAQFNREKALNIAQAGINGAQGIMKTIATFGLPLALPFVGAVVGATALQIAAIAGKKFVPQGFAEGTPLVEGGIIGKDSVPAMLMPRERVVTESDNMKYWDDLEAMRTGKYDSYIQNRYVMPQLREAHAAAHAIQGESMAANIVNGLMYNTKWNGQNIVETMKDISSEERKMQKELIRAINSSKGRKARFK